jgi:hypothetical protein
LLHALAGPLHDGQRRRCRDQRIGDGRICQGIGGSVDLQPELACIDRAGDIDGEKKGDIAGRKRVRGAEGKGKAKTQ